MKRKNKHSHSILNISKLTYKNKKIPNINELINVVEKDIGKELTPSILYSLIEKDICYDLNLIYILKKLKCVKNFKAKREECENIIKEFKHYDKHLLGKASVEDSFYIIFNGDHELSAIDFFLFCKPTKINAISSSYFHIIYSVTCNLDVIYDFIDHEIYFSSFFSEDINFSVNPIFPIIKAINFYIKKSNNMNFISNLKKNNATFNFFMILYDEYFFLKGCLKKLSYENLELYFDYAMNEELDSAFGFEDEVEEIDLWRNKIFKRLTEYEPIFEFFMNYVMQDCDRTKFYNFIFQTIKNNIILLCIFSTYRHNDHFKISIENEGEMYSKLIGCDYFEFNYKDCQKLHKFNENIIKSYIKKDPFILTSILMHYRSIKLNKIMKKMIKNIYLLFIFEKLEGPLMEINLLKIITKFYD